LALQQCEGVENHEELSQEISPRKPTKRFEPKTKGVETSDRHSREQDRANFKRKEPRKPMSMGSLKREGQQQDRKENEDSQLNHGDLLMGAQRLADASRFLTAAIGAGGGAVLQATAASFICFS
jgi:hypothetical protein